MRITVVAVGRLKERFWREACEEYLKRLGAYADLRVLEVADRDPSRLGEERALAEEGRDLLKALPQGARLVTLEIGGRKLTSEGLAAELQALMDRGVGHLAFGVGGSHGLSPEVLARADDRLSLGPLTLPHNLARVVLLEQVYRAFKICRGEPYHK